MVYFIIEISMTITICSKAYILLLLVFIAVLVYYYNKCTLQTVMHG